MKRIVLCLALMVVGSPAYAQQCRAIDGDTLRCGLERVRVTGIDAPETYFAKCDSERAKGYEAAGRLQFLLNERTIRIERQGTKDKYSRTLAKVYAGGEDVAAILIREGRARPLAPRERRRPWC